MRFFKKPWLAFLSVFTVVTGPLLASSLPPVKELLSSGEEKALAQALDILEKTLQAGAQDVVTLCLAAEAGFYYGDFLDVEKQIELWEKSLAWAKKAAALDPNSAPAYYWQGVLMGKMGRAQGILRSLVLVNPMLECLEMALELDPHYGWAYFAQSQVYQELPPKPLGRGDRRLALALAKQAWQLDPQEVEFGLHYAELLFKNGEREAARRVLEETTGLPPRYWRQSLQEKAAELQRLLAR